jgi:hypothetical protein
VNQPVKNEDTESEDLTDLEVETATHVTHVEEIVKSLRSKTCTVCGAGLGPKSHALRRRKPWMYWRVGLQCEAGHQTFVTFRATWMSSEV